MKNLVNRLKKRGWGNKDILKAVEIIENAKKVKTAESRFLEKRIYWILLLVLVAANFAVSVALIPAFIALKGAFLYSIIIVLGAVFGLLFELAIRSIEQLEKKHHLLLAFLIPMIAMGSIFAISNISNNLIKTLSLANTHSSVIISIVYAASFVLPYLIYRFALKREYYSKG